MLTFVFRVCHQTQPLPLPNFWAQHWDSSPSQWQHVWSGSHVLLQPLEGPPQYGPPCRSRPSCCSMASHLKLLLWWIFHPTRFRWIMETGERASGGLWRTSTVERASRSKQEPHDRCRSFVYRSCTSSSAFPKKAILQMNFEVLRLWSC